MAMENPFYVEAASPVKGLEGLFDGIKTNAEYAKKKSEEAQKQAIRGQMRDAVKSGDMDTLDKIFVENPWAGEELDKFYKFKNESTKQNAIETAWKVIQGQGSPSQHLIDRADFVLEQGGDPSGTIKLAEAAQKDPSAAMKEAEVLLMRYAPAEYKALKESQKGTEPKREYDKERGQVITYGGADGSAVASPIAGLNAIIDPVKKTSDITNLEHYQELQRTDPAGAKAFARMTGIEKQTGAQEYAPSDLKKTIGERQQYINQGLSPDDPIIKAYDAKITGADVDVEDMTQEEVDTWGEIVRLTGKMPGLGMSKKASKVRMRIAKSAARGALDAANLIPGADPEKRPSDAALEIVGTQTDTKAISGAITMLEKQATSMGSFVNNMEQQVDKVHAISKDLQTYDTRLLNVPLRALRGKIAGSPLQAKYDMYLTDIESEIGKLATGSTASIAELSANAQNKWEKIHDKNLSVKDMLSLLDETKNAARMRMKSVDDELAKTRGKMRKRGIVPDAAGLDAGVERSPAGQEALAWANSNPNDPRAAKIKAKLGVQ